MIQQRLDVEFGSGGLGGVRTAGLEPHARRFAGADRVAPWGSSFSDGHVVVAAARDARVAALCAHGPMMDGLSATLNIVRFAGLGQVLRLAARGQRDLLHRHLRPASD